MNVEIGKRVTIDRSCVIGNPGFSFSKDHPRTQCSIGEVVICDDVYLGPFCNVDSGTYRMTFVGGETKVDSHVHISHDCHIGMRCEIDAGATILGNVTIGHYSRICAGAIIHQNVTIGNNCVVGANSYLRHDLKDGQLAYGTPAKVVKGSKYQKYLEGLK